MARISTMPPPATGLLAMEFLARSSRWLLLLYVACICAAAHGQENSVSLGLTGFSIQGELNQVRTSLPFQLVAAPAYIYSITGNVHGVGPTYSMLVPTSEPAATAFEAISPGLSYALQGTVSNPGSQFPSTILDQQVTSGTNGVFNATFTLSIDITGVATFSVTNVRIVTNGQPDTTDELVFDSGIMTVTALFPDVSVSTFPATDINTQGATLNSTILCPNNFQAYFVYGTGTSVSGTSSMVSLAASGTAQSVSIPVTGLLPHQLYHFRAVGQDVTGPTYGKMQTFTTLDIPPGAANLSAFAGLTPLTIPVLTSATDPFGEKLKVTRVSGAIEGKAAVTKGGGAVAFQFTSIYQPEDHFTYTIADDFGGSSTGQVTVVNYATLAGTYSAVLLDPATQNAPSGFLRLTLGPTGRFTASLSIAGVTYPFTGALNSSGQFSTTLNPSALGGPTVTLGMVQAGNSYALNAGVAMNAVRLVASLPPAAAAAAEGLYTVLLPPPQGASYVGSGYALVRIAPSGLATITGALPDGAPFSCPSTVDATGRAGVFSLLYASPNRGSLAGTLALSGSGESVISGTLVWTKPADSTAGIDPGPFSITLTGSGGQYIPPVHAAALQFGANPGNIGQAVVSGGNLNSPIQCSIAIAATNVVTILGVGNDGLALTIEPATGLLSGHFIDPLSGVTRTIHGILLQGSRTGGGYFLGDSEGGAIGIGP